MLELKSKVGTKVAAAASATVAVTAGMAVTSPSAYANTLYPSGCQNWAYGLSMTPNCYVGYGNYINTNAGYDVGLGWVMNIPIGGGQSWTNWTSAHDSNTKTYQSKHSLAADGIVGHDTWGAVQGTVTFCHDDSYYAFYAKSAADCSGGAFPDQWLWIKFGTWIYHWYTLNPYDTSIWYTLGDGLGTL